MNLAYYDASNVVIHNVNFDQTHFYHLRG